MKTSLLPLILVIAALAGNALAQTTAFTYQGTLNDGTSPASGNYDFEFALFDAVSGPNQVGMTLIRNNVAVANGSFTVSLDFGGQFPGSARFLEVRVRLAGQPGITTLAPRSQINSTPYAVKSLSSDTAVNATNATTAANATQLGGVAANQYVVTTDPRMIDPRAPIAGSPNYIQNQNAEAQAAGFNISGNASAGGTLSGNIVNASTQYNIANTKMLSGNIFTIIAGPGAGAATTGMNNSLFGRVAGRDTTTGTGNSIFGSFAGVTNITGSENAYFGFFTGANATGSNNAFFGAGAGDNNGNTASNNSFFGWSAGQLNTSGTENVFLGSNSGGTNTTGRNNTLVGESTNVSTQGLQYATAIGSDAVVTSSSQVQLGRDGFDSVRIGFFANATSTGVCRNGQILALCSSSRRYKENIQPFGSGLDLVQRLQPVTFDWKGRTEHDLGFIAEDVAEIEPLLVTHNPTDGQIEGVKYDRISVALVNAVKEQQEHIEALQEKNAELQSKFDQLLKLVCSAQNNAPLCGRTEEK